MNIRTAPDIFTLKKRQDSSVFTRLENVDGFGRVSVRKLFDAIDARREIALNRFIFALGIRHVGETTARVLARAYGSASIFRDQMIAAGEDELGDAARELGALDGIGPVVAEAIADFISPVPVISMVPPAAAAALAATKSKHILIMGTQSTVRSGAYASVLKTLDPSIKVTAVAIISDCPVLSMDNVVCDLTAAFS